MADEEDEQNEEEEEEEGAAAEGNVDDWAAVALVTCSAITAALVGVDTALGTAEWTVPTATLPALGDSVCGVLSPNRLVCKRMTGTGRPDLFAPRTGVDVREVDADADAHIGVAAPDEVATPDPL